MAKLTTTDRFAFGENWRSFLATVDEERIKQAVCSLQTLLAVESLDGQRLLDIGSGSGLFSLAAHRLGAEVVSVDYDPESVHCTAQVRDRFAGDQPAWEILQGSVLDTELMNRLGRFGVVYSWGVLHHTGQLWKGIELASERTEAGGQLAIALYNDQGAASRRWLRIKQIYHRLPSLLRPVWVTMVAGVYETKFALSRLLRGKNPLPFQDWRAKKLDRGMSAWHDWVDWVGGLPFEVAKVEEVIARLEQRGFELEKLSCVGKGWGCNEFVFRRSQ